MNIQKSDKDSQVKPDKATIEAALGVLRNVIRMNEAQADVDGGKKATQYQRGRADVSRHTARELHDLLSVLTEALAFSASAEQRGYLAGLEAAKACVPGPSSMSTHGTLAACSGWNSACDQTLANLKALEEGVAKGPALERTASGANFPKKEEAKK